MLQVAVDRLHALFPTARVDVLTDSAEKLARYCPTAKPLPHIGRTLWCANRAGLGKFTGFAPPWLRNLLVWFRRTARSRYPGLLRAILIWWLRHQKRGADAEAVMAFTQALEGASLLLICGSGGFYDGCREWNLDVLDLLDAATQRGLPAVMLG